MGILWLVLIIQIQLMPISEKNLTEDRALLAPLYNRARDQQFILDYLSDLKLSDKKNAALAAIIDTDNAAIIGHSMGGFGAINTIGGCYGFTSDQLKKLGTPFALALLLPRFLNTCYAGRDTVDPRWKAVQLLAPWGGEFDVHKATAMGKISLPTFYFAGNQDNTSGFTNGIEKLLSRRVQSIIICWFLITHATISDPIQPQRCP